MAKRLRRTSRGTVILPSGEKITLSEQRALRSAVNSANRKRKRVLGKMPANRVKTKQVDESWYYKKKSVKLSRFKNKMEFNRYLRGVQKIASGKFEQKRGRVYFENYKQAIRTAFGKTTDTRRLITKVNRVGVKAMEEAIANGDIEAEIGFLYTRDQQQRQYDKIDAMLDKLLAKMEQ